METNPIRKIAIAGSGNVATHLGKALKKSGFNITGIYSRNIEKATMLAETLSASATDEISLLPEADMVVLAVPDSAVQKVAENLAEKYRLTVHVSGSTPMDVLKPFGQQYGVLYPLQTFSVFRPMDFSGITVCVEGCCDAVTQQLQHLAGSLTKDVRLMNSEQRLSVHLAAVFASNFANYLNLEAVNILENAGISRDILFPLMQETLNKMLDNHPYETQTGPAIRKDHGTMEKHLAQLSHHPEKQKIYQILSEQIIRTFE